MITVKSLRDPDIGWIKQLTTSILANYDGGGNRWDLSSVEELFPIKLGERSAVLRTSQDVCIKFFYDKSFKSRLRDFIGLSKAKKTYELGKAVSDLGVPIPKLFGLAKVKFSYGLVLSKFEQEYEPIQNFVKSDHDSKIWSELGSFIRLIHDKNVSHKDLAPKNVLVKKSGDVFSFLLLDYEDCKIHKRISDKQRLDDLFHMYERLYQIANEANRKQFVSGYIAGCLELENYEEKLLEMIKKNPSKYTQS